MSREYTTKLIEMIELRPRDFLNVCFITWDN